MMLFESSTTVNIYLYQATSGFVTKAFKDQSLTYTMLYICVYIYIFFFKIIYVAKLLNLTQVVKRKAETCYYTYYSFSSCKNSWRGYNFSWR